MPPIMPPEWWAEGRRRHAVRVGHHPLPQPIGPTPRRVPWRAALGLLFAVAFLLLCVFSCFLPAVLHDLGVGGG